MVRWLEWWRAKVYFLSFLLQDFWLYYGIISTLKIVENSEEKAIKDHMFNPLLASYFNVNYLGFLFLSFSKKKEVQTSTLLTMPRNANSALSTLGYKYPHGWWAHLSRASQQKFWSCSLSLQILLSHLPHRYAIMLILLLIQWEKNVFSQIQ